MRGLGFREHGGPERVEWVERPTPEPGPGEVRVRVRAAAFNRLDRFVLAGIPGVPIERPHILGSDASGVVDAVGSGVRSHEVGASVLVNPGLWDGTCPECRAGEEALCRAYRILGEHTQGSVTEFVVLPERNLHPKPESLSFVEAAAVPLVYQTAWRALRTVGALQPDETVAIVGAGGGVAPAAVQVARDRGARVVVLSRSEEKLARVRAAGGAETLRIPEDGQFDRALWAWSEKRGVDLVFDSVGTSTIPRSLRALARGGRLVVIGATSGPEVTVDLRTLFWRQASIRGSTMANQAEFAAMLAEVGRGTLRAVVDSDFGFDEAGAAFTRFLEPDLFGKVVVRGP